MNIARSIGAGAAVAAIFTHGVVSSAVNLTETLPVSAYQGFFRHILLATERLWSYAHGWQPMSHIHDFGRFYAPVVQLICPLIGFALFWILSRHKLSIDVLKPVALALVLAIPSSFIDGVPGYALPWVEVARTLLVVGFMVSSVGAIRISKACTRTTSVANGLGLGPMLFG
jgi:hypothetical protein